jgi:hypothetical protein
MKARKLASITIALLLLGGIFAGGQIFADVGHKSHHKNKAEENMPACHEAMSADPAALEEQIATIKNARGDEKMEAMVMIMEQLAAHHRFMQRCTGCMKKQGEKDEKDVGTEEDTSAAQDESLQSSTEAHVKYHY